MSVDDSRIFDLIRAKPRSSSEVGRELGISRQAAHRRLQKLVASGVLDKTGAARATRYHLNEAPLWERQFDRAGLDESEVYRAMHDEIPALANADTDLADLSAYAITEIVNNAIDHSGGVRIDISVVQAGPLMTVSIADDGVGVFAHVQSALELPDELAALQEITKGKTTTAPDRHSGEGLFFVSKAVNCFRLESHQLAWIVDNDREEWTVDEIDPRRGGTLARLELDVERLRDLATIFERYTEDYEFSKTQIVVDLFSIGDSFISRSEAKRLLHNLDRFKTVILDFRDVRTVGQGFADQVFRVWAGAHPDIELISINASRSVELMINRSR